MGCPISPIYWGWPSISTSKPAVGLPPMPRRFIPPAAPVDTPYPMMPRLVANSPGTCSVSAGSTDGWKRCSNTLRFTTEMVIGRCRISVSFLVPVTTTSSIVRFRAMRALSFAACANPAIVQRPATERSNMFFFFIRIAFLIICSAKDRAYFLFPFVL